MDNWITSRKACQIKHKAQFLTCVPPLFSAGCLDEQLLEGGVWMPLVRQSSTAYPHARSIEVIHKLDLHLARHSGQLATFYWGTSSFGRRRRAVERPQGSWHAPRGSGTPVRSIHPFEGPVAPPACLSSTILITMRQDDQKKVEFFDALKSRRCQARK